MTTLNVLSFKEYDRAAKTTYKTTEVGPFGEVELVLSTDWHSGFKKYRVTLSYQQREQKDGYSVTAYTYGDPNVLLRSVAGSTRFSRKTLIEHHADAEREVITLLKDRNSPHAERLLSLLEG